MASRDMLGCSQFGGLKRCKTIGVVEDRISGLPDETLIQILNLLTLKEAIATGILSKRWRYLWAWRPDLDLGCLPRPNRFTYVQIVNKILQQHNAPKLRKLRIAYPLFDSLRHHIDDWISLAIRKGVSELNFDIPSLGSLDYYYIPAHIFGGLPNAGKHFESLTQLCLRCVNLTDQVFDLILSNCFSLERFLLMSTRGLVNAKNTTPHFKLKSLELYYVDDLEYLQLFAPNLMSFQYQGRERTLRIQDSKHLASLRLSINTFSDPNTSSIFPRGKGFLFCQFSSYLPKLESFVVEAEIFKDMIDFTELYVFSSLKQLKLDVINTLWNEQSYRVAASIIRAAPYLELLEIILPGTSLSQLKCKALELTSMTPHQNLKEVKLFGFRGDENTMEFLAYLVQFAVSLQKIDITAFRAFRCGDNLRVEPRLSWNADDAEHSKNRVLQLRQTMHSDVHLVFHDC